VSRGVYFIFSNGVLYFDGGRGHYRFVDNSYQPANAASTSGTAQIVAPMDGTIVEVLVKQNQSVESGQVVAVLEAMKMAHQLKAMVSGEITLIGVKQGQQVQAQHLVASVAPSSGSIDE
jgi:geranyl-CoA carboxylase alpha subunit